MDKRECLCEAGEVCHLCLGGRSSLLAPLGGDGSEDLAKYKASHRCECGPYQLCRACAPEDLAILVNARFALARSDAMAEVPQGLRRLYGTQRLPSAEDN